MIDGNAKYIFRIAFDVVVVLSIASLAFLVYETRVEVDIRKNELLKCVSTQGGLTTAHQDNIIQFRKTSAKVPSTFSSQVIQKAYEFELVTRKLERLATSTLVLAVILVAGYKTQEYQFFKKPRKLLADRITASTTTDTAEYDLHEARKKPLKELVESLLESRKDSERFINEIAKGNLEYKANFKNNDQYTNALLAMQQKLQAVSSEEKRILWVNEKLASLENIIKNSAEQSEFYTKLISFITQQVSCSIGTFYVFKDIEQGAYFELTASYGYYNNTKAPLVINAGDGQLGQVAYEKKPVRLENVPSKFLTIHSGLGSAPATHITIIPLLFKDALYGAIELGSFSATPEYQILWLQKVGESIGAFLFNKKVTIESKEKLEKLSQDQALELVQIHALQRETNQRLQLKLKEADDERLKNQAILEGCVDGVISFTTDGKIIFCNNSLLDMLSLDRNDIHAKTLFELMPVKVLWSDEKMRPIYFDNELQKEIQIRTEASIRSVGGESVDVLITSTEVTVNDTTIFTFFIQKISIDLF